MMCDDFGIIMEANHLPDDDLFMDEDDIREIRSIRTEANKARDRYFRWLLEFGMTPASRGRVQRAKPITDSLSTFLNEQL
jgi:hypothetical protein